MTIRDQSDHPITHATDCAMVTTHHLTCTCGAITTAIHPAGYEHPEGVAYCECGYTSTAVFETCTDSGCPATNSGTDHAHRIRTEPA